MRTHRIPVQHVAHTLSSHVFFISFVSRAIDTGGVRAPAFVTGGTNTLPLAARGKHALGLLHHVDVARTLAALGGANGSAMGDDGFDMWSSMVLGSDASAAASSNRRRAD